MRLLAGLLAGLFLISGCSEAGSPSATPGPPPTPDTPRTSSPSLEPTPEPSASPEWVVGATPLPERPDGFGEIWRTPQVLRDRRLQQPDVLPPPADGRFTSRVEPISQRFVRRTSLAWSPGCPVSLADLRYVGVSFWGFDDRPHTGQLVLAAPVVDDAVQVFERLFEARFPIEEMRLITQADLDAPPTGDGNNTGSYACRPVVGTTNTWSAHALGLAIDVNPFQNPYTRRDGGDLVLPELASAYLDREWRRPGMIDAGGVVTEAFAEVGWTWGSTFSTVDDRHHFSANGR